MVKALFGFGKPKKKLFSVPLDVCIKNGPLSENDKDFGLLPLPLARGIRYVEEKYIDVEGIYRVSGIKSSVEGLIKLYDEGKDPDLSTYDPYVITGMIKRYLTLVPEPIMTYDLYEPFLAAAKIKDKGEKRKKIRELVEKLPDLNKRVLAFVAKHLKKVSDHKDENKMGPNNLAIVFGPSIFRTTDDSAVRMLTDAPLLSGCVQMFLLEFDFIFNGKEAAEQNAPTTPTAPTVGQDSAPVEKASPSDKRKSRKSLDLTLATNATNNSNVEDPSERANRRKNNRQGFKNMENVLGQKEAPPADVNQLMADLVQTAVTETISVDDMASPRELLAHKESWRKDNTVSEPLSSYITVTDNDIINVEDKEDTLLRDFATTATASQQVVDLDAELGKITYNFDSPLDAITQRLQFLRAAHKRSDEVAKMTQPELEEERKFLKQEIRSYEKAYTETFKKELGKQEKEKIRPIYKRYQLVKKLAEQTLLPSTPVKEHGDGLDDMISPKSPLYEVLAMQNAQSPKKPRSNTTAAVGDAQRAAGSLRAAYSRKSVQLSNDVNPSSSSNNTSPVKQQEVESEIHDLKEKKKKLQRQIHQFQNEFEKEHGRKPNKQEKQSIQHLYDEYKDTKTKLEELCK